MNKILNYIKINELIATSGQLKIAEFELIANEGFEVIINLALNNSSNAIENEDKIVTDLNMTYIHIPVNFENPNLSDDIQSKVNDYKDKIISGEIKVDKK